MGYSTTKMQYNYEVNIDLSKIIEKILEILPGDIDEVELSDTDELIIRGSDTTTASVWHCRQTLESPEEYDVELKNSVEDINLQDKILDIFKNVQKDDFKAYAEADQESFEGIETEPDPDRAYDEWRDRQLEENW